MGAYIRELLLKFAGLLDNYLSFALEDTYVDSSFDSVSCAS